MARPNEQGAPTSHSQVETLKVKRAGGDAAGPGGSCSPWHDESGSQPVPLPKTQTSCQSGERYPAPSQHHNNKSLHSKFLHCLFCNILSYSLQLSCLPLPPSVSYTCTHAATVNLHLC